MKLQRASINILSQILQAPGWYQGNAGLMYTAGTILIEVLKPFESPEHAPPEGIKEDAEVRLKWLSTPFDLELTPTQVEACSAALQSAVSQSTLPINAYTYELLKSFGIGN